MPQSRFLPYRPPRPLHPGAWWAWALGLAVAASRTTNPLVLGLLVACACLVVATRRTNAPWAMSFRLYLWLAAFIVVLRTAFRIVFSGDGTTVLFSLPTLALPDFLAESGASILGPVSAEALLGGAYGGLQLGAMIVCVGAANTLANPRRLLAALPGALYELGSVVVIALSVFPQLAESVQRVNRARLLRTGQAGGRHVLREVFLPVFADALDRSLDLAAAMDSRGYGRRADVAPARRRLTSAVLIVAVLALCVGAYAALDSTMPAAASLPLLVAGLVAAAVGLWLAGRWTPRSRYRPDRWGLAATWTAACGIAPAAVLSWLAARGAAELYPSVDPLAWPTLTAPVLVAVAVAALPAITTHPKKAA